MQPLTHLDNTAGWLLAGFVVILLAVDLRHDVRRLIRGRNVVLIGILVWYLIEAMMLPESMHRIDENLDQPVFSQALYNQGLLYVALAAVSFILVYDLCTPWQWQPASRLLLQLENPGFLWKIVLIGAAIGFTPVIVIGGFEAFTIIDSALKMRSQAFVLGRGRYGGFREAFLELQMFVRAVAPFAFLLILDKSSSVLKRLFCLIVVAYPLLYSLATGTRNSLFLGAAPLAAVLYWKASPLAQRRMIYFLTIPLVYLTLTISAVMVAGRNAGEFSIEEGSNVPYIGYEMFSPMLSIMTLVPEKHDYLYGVSYWIQLINPIPRALWPDKPILETGLLLSILEGSIDERSGEAFLTTSPGIIGEMYFNFGWIGIILLSGLGGWVVRSWDTLVDRYSMFPAVMTVYSMGLAALFFFGRSLNIHTAYGLIAFFILLYFTTCSKAMVAPPI